MSTDRLPDGPDLDEMIQLICGAFPDAVVATIDSAAFFSLDDKHWPNFATVVWTDEHDEGAPSKARHSRVGSLCRLARALPDDDHATVANISLVIYFLIALDLQLKTSRLASGRRGSTGCAPRRALSYRTTRYTTCATPPEQGL